MGKFSAPKKHKDAILKKFKFVKSLKNYVLSKIHNTKYDLSNSTEQEISIVSYDQRSFVDVEKELDLQGKKSVKIDPSAFAKLRQALNEDLRNNNLQNTAHRELLEIAEKTFARQLDIFEGILKLINAKSNEDDVDENVQQKLVLSCINDETIDAFAGSIVKNLINELTKGIRTAAQRSVEESHKTNTEDNLQDYKQTKGTNIYEFQHTTTNGAPVCKPQNAKK